MSKFKVNNLFEYPDLQSHTAESGKRVYYTPEGPAPSVTTILSTIPNPGLDEWRERVGEEEANRVSKEATTIGTYMHDMLEAHVDGFPYQPPEGFDEDLMEFAREMFRAVTLFGLKDLDEVWGVEVALYLEQLYAGRTDLVGVFKRKPSIIDYKTSKFHKKDAYLEHYKMQIAAYKMAHEEMFPEQRIEQGVLLIGQRPNAKFKKRAQLQTVIIDEEELLVYQEKWLDVLEGYYA